MSLVEVIEEFASAELRDEDGYEVSIDLGPPVTAARRAEVEAILGPLPDDVAALYDRCAWLDEMWLEPAVDFTNAERDFADIFERVVRLGGDGFGNFWVVDVDHAGAWGPVFFACHDPPAIVLQAPSLELFLRQLLESGHDPDDPMIAVHDKATMAAWREQRPGRSVDEARASDDPELAAFAARLEAPARIVDLRPRPIGAGWSQERPYLGRQGLLFAVQGPDEAPEKSWWERLLGW